MLNRIAGSAVPADGAIYNLLNIFYTFAPKQVVLSLFAYAEGGKSGQRRAPCFLTGRRAKACSKVTENDHPRVLGGTGEKAR